ncbi:MAG TPA: glycosyltransferase family 4 protein [Phycisphaerae bacterium]|nr:glycosyltransferase family 4 protein [Phycisphaerae bacterium]
MKILHITPHLGGGIGKAHLAIAGALPKGVEQTVLLLEQPRDPRFPDAIAAAGVRVVTAQGLDDVADLADAADIVQFEFWNHPRMYECLGRAAFPAMRSVFWSHISGLTRPIIPQALMEEAGRFVFTTEASRSIPSIARLSAGSQRKLAVINSGFGFADAPPRETSRGGTPAIAYLGTVDFVKMHPGFFEAIDRLDSRDVRVLIWGAVDPSGPVVDRASAMRHPERIRFCGHTPEPAAALSGAEIFFYPLQPDHYGTGENALIEAMSIGLVPLVLRNSAEMTIVSHGVTGFVARSIDECVALLQMLLCSPDVRERISRNARTAVAETRTPARSARQFMELWRRLLDEPKRFPDFRRAVGAGPADWYLATQCLPGQAWEPTRQSAPEPLSKGGLRHFENAFPGDESLARLRFCGEARPG